MGEQVAREEVGTGWTVVGLGASPPGWDMGSQLFWLRDRCVGKFSVDYFYKILAFEDGADAVLYAALFRSEIDGEHLRWRKPPEV